MNPSQFKVTIPWLALVARLYLGTLFIVACLHKIAHPEQFAIDVATYQFLPLALVNPFALVVPWIELWVGVFLLLGVFVPSSALITALLMASFMVALGHALSKGLNMSCGCFASQGAKNHDPISWLTMVRDLAWLLLALFVLGWDRNPIGLLRLRAKGTLT